MDVWFITAMIKTQCINIYELVSHKITHKFDEKIFPCVISILRIITCVILDSFVVKLW